MVRSFIEVNDLPAHRNRRRTFGMPFTPDAVGTDIQEFDLGVTIVTGAQRFIFKDVVPWCLAVRSRSIARSLCTANDVAS
jgi:hypothetical protein